MIVDAAVYLLGTTSSGAVSLVHEAFSFMDHHVSVILLHYSQAGLWERSCVLHKNAIFSQFNCMCADEDMGCVRRHVNGWLVL